ncbi:MAG: glutathione S-transferase N-terminal domain-containing protein [Gammaproteobacteria bacterium]
MTALTNRRSVMTLYAKEADLIGHCVRLVLMEKDIHVEIHFIDEETKPEDLNALNPYASVLTLIDRDLVLYDAQIMLEYLDERYPHPPLMPVDPVSRANNRQFRFRIVRDLFTSAEVLDGDNDIAAANARKSLRDNLMALAPIFSQNPYFMSQEFSLTDMCMGPLLWRLPHYGVKLTAQAKPLVKYADKLFDRPAFQSSLSPVEQEMR